MGACREYPWPKLYMMLIHLPPAPHLGFFGVSLRFAHCKLEDILHIEISLSFIFTALLQFACSYLLDASLKPTGRRHTIWSCIDNIGSFIVTFDMLLGDRVLKGTEAGLWW